MNWDTIEGQWKQFKGSAKQAWSKLKASLRATGARSREALEAALGPALATITAQDARAWFRLAGYVQPAN